jgi:two-component system NtrC family sensor kinase
MPLKSFKEKWEAHLPRRMRSQMALALAALVAVPLMLLGWLLIGESQQAVKTSVLRDQQQLVLRVASELGEFIQRPQDLLRSTAAILGVLRAGLWKQETALVELALNQEIFGRISSLDLSGKEIVTSELGTPLKDRSSDPAFQNAVEGNFYMSGIGFSKDHTPYVTMAVPVRHLGKIVAVLAAEVRLRGFWDIVDSIRVGETGKAYVVSGNGILVAGEDKKKVLANENLMEEEAVKAALAGKAGSLESTSTDGRAWLKAYASIPGLGWAVIVKQSADEAYSFLRLMKIEAWILIVLSIGLAVLLSAFLAHLLVSPIQLLAGKMGRVAQGDFDQRLALHRKDEIGDLMSAFNQMTEQLKKARESEKLAVIGKAAAAITHELKNSLVMVSTFIGLLPHRHADHEFLKKFSTVLPQELENWKNMLEEISDYSRKSGFELSEVRLDNFIQDFVFLVEQKLLQHGVRLEYEGTRHFPAVRANAPKLKQALLNLVMNAVEAMPGGGKIKLWVRDCSPEIEIGIQDTGQGIPADRFHSIFEPFYTTKVNGLGLGLAVCREIIEQHGGRLSLESRQGAGTTFYVHLPLPGRQAGVPARESSVVSKWN